MVTLNDLKQRNGYYFALSNRIRQLLWQMTSTWLKLDTHCLQNKCSPRILFYWRYVIYGDNSIDH